MVNTTLFLANVVILLVMAAAFTTALLTQQRERYLASWTLANLVIALALALYTIHPLLPPLVTAAGANTLLILGFGLRWRAIREFNGRVASPGAVLVPMMAYLGLGTIPSLLLQAGLVYGLVNILLAATVAAICFEIVNGRGERLPSRMGLVAVYAIMGCSFAVRAVQGLIDPFDPRVLPGDLLLTIHLSIALVHTTGSGAFALAMAFERHAAGLRRAAMTDWMTGLANRRAFDLMLAKSLAEASPAGTALIVFDIDNFKLVNDRHGHATGDAVLVMVADAARAALGSEAVLARIGGEEFGAIVSGCSAAEARNVAEAVRVAIARARPEDLSGPRAVTVSLGVEHFRAGDSGDAVMRAADTALYCAKRNGRNRVECASPEARRPSRDARPPRQARTEWPRPDEIDRAAS